MNTCESPITMTAGEALAAYRLVIPSSETVVYCDATLGHMPIGATTYGVASGDDASITLLSPDRTIQLETAGAIAQFARVYPAADGKIVALPATGGLKPCGIAMAAATASGDIIEVLPFSVQDVEPAATSLTAAAPAIVPGSVNQIDSSSNAVDATLGSGLFIGQQTRVVMTEASNSSTVTVALHETSDPEVFTFDAVDEYLVLEWSGTEWVTIKATATV